MKKEFINLLVQDFPNLYEARRVDMIGFSCGWYPLIRELSQNITSTLSATNGCGVHATQIKEKFGGLRFYVLIDASIDNEIKEKIRSLINKAESESVTICENCGEPGKTINPPSGWVLTLCEACAKNTIKRYGEFHTYK